MRGRLDTLVIMLVSIFVGYLDFLKSVLSLFSCVLSLSLLFIILRNLSACVYIIPGNMCVGWQLLKLRYALPSVGLMYTSVCNCP